MDVRRLFSIISPVAWFLLFLVGIDIVISLPYLRAPLAGDPDGYGRVIQSWFPLIRGKFWAIDYNSWPALYFFIMRLGLLVIPDFFHTPQVLTFLVSIAGIPLYYRFARSVLSRNEALWSAAFYTLIPIRYILSTTPLAEGLALPLLLLPLIMVVQKRLSLPWFIAGILGLAVASGIRCEAWYLLPIIWYTAIRQFRSSTMRFAAIAGSLVVPLWWTASAVIATHSLNTYVTERLFAFTGSLPTLYHNPFTTGQTVFGSLLTLIPFPLMALAILGTYGLADKRGSRSQTGATRMLIFLPWYFTGILFLQFFIGSMEWVTLRFFLYPTLLMIPLGVHGATLLLKKFPMLTMALLCFMIATVPSYVSFHHRYFTQDVLLGSARPDKLAAVDEVVRYIDRIPKRRFDYVIADKGNYDFATMISYFTKQDAINHVVTDLSAVRAHPESYATTLVVEKRTPEHMALPETILENDYFAVIENPEGNPL
jgi:hypothetical protein